MSSKMYARAAHWLCLAHGFSRMSGAIGVFHLSGPVNAIGGSYRIPALVSSENICRENCLNHCTQEGQVLPEFRYYFEQINTRSKSNDTIWYGCRYLYGLITSAVVGSLSGSICIDHILPLKPLAAFNCFTKVGKARFGLRLRE